MLHTESHPGYSIRQIDSALGKNSSHIEPELMRSEKLYEFEEGYLLRADNLCSLGNFAKWIRYRTYLTHRDVVVAVFDVVVVVVVVVAVGGGGADGRIGDSRSGSHHQEE